MRLKRCHYRDPNPLLPTHAHEGQPSRPSHSEHGAPGRQVVQGSQSHTQLLPVPQKSGQPLRQGCGPRHEKQ